MEFFLWGLAILIILLSVIFIFKPSGGTRPTSGAGKKPTRPKPGIMKTRSRTNRPTRRRRLSGGYYPVGYTGEYLPGEELIDFVIWMTILSELSDEERIDMGEYGNYGDYTEEDLEDEIFNQEQYSTPEAETFEVIEEDDNKSGWGGDSDDSSSSWDSDDSDGWDN